MLHSLFLSPGLIKKKHSYSQLTSITGGIEEKGEGSFYYFFLIFLYLVVCVYKYVEFPHIYLFIFFCVLDFFFFFLVSPGNQKVHQSVSMTTQTIVPQESWLFFFFLPFAPFPLFPALPPFSPKSNENIREREREKNINGCDTTALFFL